MSWEASWTDIARAVGDEVRCECCGRWYAPSEPGQELCGFCQSADDQDE